MRKYLLPSALILLLGLGYSFAQTITKAIQLSQDATGVFAVDSNNGVYFPGHILSPTKGVVLPTVTSGGTNTPAISGTDTAGTVTMGTSAASASVVFGTTYNTAPQCVLSSVTGVNTPTPMTYNTVLTGIIISQGVASANKWSYICMAAS